MTDIAIANPDAMHEIGIRLASQLRAGDIVVLTGELGAGKTTLTRGIGEGLEVRGAVSSPTFVIARTHRSTSRDTPFVHVDAYRIDNAMELDDLDIDFDHSIVVMEWGRGKVEAITDSWLDIEIDRARGGESDAVDPHDEPDEPRRMRLIPHGAEWAAREPALIAALAQS